MGKKIVSNFAKFSARKKVQGKQTNIEIITIDKSSTRANKKVLSQFLNEISQAGSSEQGIFVEKVLLIQINKNNY